jgi:DNA polymerase, archaea type
MTSGWLFDAYPLDNKMIFWIKQENGNTVRLQDNNWSPSVYVVSDNYTDLLKSLQEEENLIKTYDFALRYERINDTKQSKVLKLTLLDSTKASTLARKIETLDARYRVYNVDIPAAQSYFYEHNIFPLAFCEVHNNPSKLTWNNKDSVWSTNYKIPDFKAIHLTVNIRKGGGKIPRYTDRIDSISIKQEQKLGDEQDVKNKPVNLLKSRVNLKQK